MRLSFIYPEFLWLLLLLPLLWGLAFATRTLLQQRLARWRVWALLGLRTIALLALILALAGVQLVRPVHDLAVVFLVDGSDSVSPAQRDAAVAYINEALAERGERDQAAVVLFGENAVVERAPAVFDQLGRLSSTVLAGRTNIEEAIQLGMALLPADAQKRIVLLSDGRENSGRAADAARLAASRNIPIDVVELVGSSGADVVVAALRAPDVAREGQDITLLVRIESSITTSGRLQLFVNGELAGTQEVDIPAGTSDLSLSVPGGSAGFARYEVRLEAGGDTQPLNNRAAAFTEVQGPPRVLLIASDATRAAALRSALDAAQVRTELLGPTQVPADPIALQDYAAIILVDVSAREVPRPLQEALPIYVRDQGGSLAMIGGFDAYGAGGWRRSPVAEVLPVELDPRDRQERPDLALGLVIDRSGSMAESGGTGLTKIDLAKEAVYQATLGLSESDYLGVVIFDSTADWVLELQRLPGIVAIEQALSRISPGGGTNIRSGIAPAARALQELDARVKHVILLTDGIAESNYADLIQEMRNNQVTITVVSIGQGANPALRNIAEIGGGRFYQVNSLNDVPSIFLTETVMVAGRDIVEETIAPRVALNTPLLRGIESLPLLYGYNGTEPRPTARTILVTPDEKPILAQWQFGLGRALAWTSDFKGQWARDWINWEGFPRFAGGLIDALLPPEQVEGIALEMRTDGPQAIVELTALDAQGRPLDGALPEGRLLNPAGTGEALAFTQVGPGRYRATTDATASGVYLAQVLVRDAGGQPVGSVSGGLAVAYSPEYAAGTVRPALPGDLAELTGARVTPAAEDIFVPTAQPIGVVQEIGLALLWLALLLWPLDIALRRLMLRRSDFAPFFVSLRGRLARPVKPAPVRDAGLTQLQAARSRAGRGRERPAATPAQTRPEQPTTATATETPPTPPPAPPQMPPPAASPQALRPDDPLASLLAAKQRARRKRDAE